MILKNQSRERYIGASDNGMVNSNFDNPSFQKWWSEKIGMTSKKYWENEYTKAGTILESEILNQAEIPQENRNISIKLKDSVIGVNLDGFHNGKLIEAKTMKFKLAFKVMNGYALSAGYKRQMNHGMYVLTEHFKETGENIIVNKAEMYILPVTDKDYKNPFGADLNLLFKIDYKLPNIDRYVRRLRYLDYCFQSGEMPSEANFAKFQK